MKTSRKILAGVAILLVAVGFVMASRPDPVPVEVGTVAEGPFQVTIDEEGRTRVRERYVVAAPITGNLLRVTLEPGDVVSEGAVLATLVPIAPALLDARTRAELEARVRAASAGVRQAEAAMAQAEAAARHATHELEIVRGLFKQGVVPTAQRDQAELEQTVRARALEAARFATRMARFEAEGARAALRQSSGTGNTSRWEVKAPVKGRVLRVMQEQQGPIAAGTPLLEVADLDALEVVIDVLTADAVEVKPGAPVRIERWGGDRVLNGRVRLIEPSGFTRLSALGVEEQRVNVVVDLTDPRTEWQALGDGYRVEARIETHREEKALKVPVTALFRQGSGWAVFAVEKGKAVVRGIEVGKRNGLDAQVVKGLEAGQAVILHPGDKVKEGVAVAAREDGAG